MAILEKREDASSSSSSAVKPVTSFNKDNLETGEVITSIVSANGRSVQVTNDVDPAMRIALEGNLEYDAVADRKLLWKIDLIVLPICCCVYIVQSMDKGSMSISSVLGLRSYFGMHGDQYSWCGSAFYLGYLIFELPASAILQRLPVGKAMTGFILLWALVIFLHGAVKTYPGFVAMRVLLGMFESAINPGMVILTSQYYRKEEHFMRSSIWFGISGLGGIFSNCVSYSLVLHMDSYSVPAWKLNFFIMGAVTVVIGVAFFFLIPDDPSKAWFFSEKEKAMIVARLRDNQQGFGSKKWKWPQFKEALTDVITWYYFWYGVSSDVPSGALGTFGSILLNEDFGFSLRETMLMNMPGHAIYIVSGVLFAAATPYCWNSRMFISWFSSVGVTIASCLLAFPSNSKVKLAGFFLQNLCGISMAQCLACFESNTAGQTKKVVTNAIFLIGYCIGMLIGPQFMLESQAPGYIGGKIAIVVTYAASLVFLQLIWFEYWRRNKKRDKQMREHPEIYESAKNIENIEFTDLTDLENPYFRYVL